MEVSSITPYLLAALAVIVGANYGLPITFGAHPFWAVSVAWIGVPLGLILAFVARSRGLGWMSRVLTFALGLCIAYVIATFGKAGFAASYAESALAGRLWYFGWIASMAFASALVAAALSPGRSQAKG